MVANRGRNSTPSKPVTPKTGSVEPCWSVEWASGVMIAQAALFVIGDRVEHIRRLPVCRAEGGRINQLADFVQMRVDRDPLAIAEVLEGGRRPQGRPIRHTSARRYPCAQIRPVGEIRPLTGVCCCVRRSGHSPEAPFRGRNSGWLPSPEHSRGCFWKSGPSCECRCSHHIQ